MNADGVDHSHSEVVDSPGVEVLGNYGEQSFVDYHSEVGECWVPFGLGWEGGDFLVHLVL